jgi:hypothetical protein
MSSNYSVCDSGISELQNHKIKSVDMGCGIIDEVLHSKYITINCSLP